jgi:hypothetical protein
MHDYCSKTCARGVEFLDMLTQMSLSSETFTTDSRPSSLSSEAPPRSLKASKSSMNPRPVISPKYANLNKAGGVVHVISAVLDLMRLVH